MGDAPVGGRVSDGGMVISNRGVWGIPDLGGLPERLAEEMMCRTNRLGC